METRREFLGKTAAAAGLMALGGPLAACGEESSARRVARRHRIVVVGAGLAGLSCAHRLRQQGVAATVYEARPDRVGGRCWSARDFADGQVGEHGGELIDSDHSRVRALARELGLQLEDRVAYARRNPGAESRLYLDGVLRDEDRVYADYGAFRRSLRGVSERELDRHTARELLDRAVPGGAGSLLGQAMRGFIASEFGLDAERLSAASLSYLREVPEASAAELEIERFHVSGGNDQLATGMAERLPPAALRLDAPLEALWRRGDGGYGMRFAGIAGDVVAERVVLAIPFTTLRRVDLGGAGLSRRKREAIEELGMGTNSKLLMQFDRRPEDFGNWDGALTIDAPQLETFDTSLTQPGRSSLITVFTGGRVGKRIGEGARGPHAPAPAGVVREALAAIGRAVPGISAAFNGRAWLDHWSADPWSRGSYAAVLPGQVTRFSGMLGRREGGIHFAGEQTSIEYPGYLEGAIESGERCALEILRS
jgi:monoamine oxidase